MANEQNKGCSGSFDLSRFVRAQAGVYERALGELRDGFKTSHWMWFIFPQMRGLGLSETSRLYSISGREEALAFLHHDLLGQRFVECTEAMINWGDRRRAVDILGPIDTLKFRSSMTLFDAVASEQYRFGQALDLFFDGERDPATLQLLD